MDKQDDAKRPGRHAAYLAAIAALESLDDEQTEVILSLLRSEVSAVGCKELLVRCEMPLLVVGEGNIASRRFWTHRHRRMKDHRGNSALLVQSAWGRTKPPKPPLLIVLTVLSRTAHRMDSDTLPTSCKGIRDGIADWIGVDDGDPSLVWRYDEAKHSVPGKFGVLVLVYGKGEPRSRG